jgi:hypothetical protein
MVAIGPITFHLLHYGFESAALFYFVMLMNALVPLLVITGSVCKQNGLSGISATLRIQQISGA